MRKGKNSGIDVEIDEMTNSIKNVVSGDSFSTDITRITKIDLKRINKKNGWQFDWKIEPSCRRFSEPVKTMVIRTLSVNHLLLFDWSKKSYQSNYPGIN